jgi:hypothetical protein
MFIRKCFHFTFAAKTYAPKRYAAPAIGNRKINGHQKDKNQGQKLEQLLHRCLRLIVAMVALCLLMTTLMMWWESTSKEHIENVFGIDIVFAVIITTRRTTIFIIRCIFSEAIVRCPFLVVTEDGKGLSDSFESVLGPGRTVFVRVKLQCQLR